jgi:hypothetical protein
VPMASTIENVSATPRTTSPADVPMMPKLTAPVTLTSSCLCGRMMSWTWTTTLHCDSAPSTPSLAPEPHSLSWPHGTSMSSSFHLCGGAHHICHRRTRAVLEGGQDERDELDH